MGADDQAHSVMTVSKMQKTIVIALLNNQMALKLKYEVSTKYHYTTLNVLLQYILVCKSTFNNVGRHFLLKCMYQGLSNFCAVIPSFISLYRILQEYFSGLEKSPKKRKNTFSHN